MSVTYPADPAKPYGDRIETLDADVTHGEAFVPVYARRGRARGGQGKLRTWMILTPVAVLVLGGIGVVLAMSGGEEASGPLVEPAATAPVLSAMPTETAVAPLASASAPEPVVAAAPVVSEAAPLRRPAAAPAPREAIRAPGPTAAAAPRAASPEPTVPTGPQPYTPAPASPSTSTLNTAPATPAPTPPPVIIVEPAG